MALTKVTGELVDIGDLDISNVGSIQLDSIAGDADSNTSITFSGSDVITVATGGSTAATFNADQTTTLSGAVTANAGVVVDNITIDGTEIDLSSGDLTIDVAGDIELNADGGDINFKDGSDFIGKFKNSSNNFVVKSVYQDADLIIQGNDGGSDVTALTLDMSDAGAATFNAGISLAGTITTTAATPSVILYESDTTDVNTQLLQASGDFRIRTRSDDGSTNTDRLRIDHAGGSVLIGTDSGDSFNADSMLRLQRAGDRVFMQFKTDADQNSGILFGDVDDDVECAIEYEPANKALTFSTGNNTEAIRIDTNQNVGIGTTSPSLALEVNDTANVDGEQISIKGHADYGGTVVFRRGDSYTWRVGVGGGSSTNSTIPNSYFGFEYGNTLAMTIAHTTGNVGIGTTSPSRLLDINSTANDAYPLKIRGNIDNDGGYTGIVFGYESDVTTYEKAVIHVEGTSGSVQPDMHFLLHSGANSSNATISDARLSILNGGNVGIGTTSPSTKLYVYNAGGGSSDCMTVQSGSTANSNVGMILFRDNDQDYCGQITTNGSTNTAIYNANTSDERLKENITDWDIDALALFKNIEPKEFNFKSQDEGAPKVRGYIAQTEVSKFPEAFTTDSSEEAYYSYNPGGMVIYLMKALKEQVAINEALEARITALESS